MRLRLQPCSFKQNEEVELYWLCSPYYNIEQGWLIKAAFRQQNNEIVEITFPWGTIPYLIIGQKYCNGLPCTTGKRGRIFELTIPDRSIFEICNAYDIPPTLYYFYKNHNYGLQKICKFTIKDKNYYIPCLEIVRTFLTPHTVLANCIMKPGGLGHLIERIETRWKDLYIDLTDEVPRRIVCDETAAYIAWLKYDVYAHKTWNLVYNKVFNNAIEKAPYNAVGQFQKGTYIEALPPVGKGSKWSFRGIADGNDILILELLSKSNLYMPFDNIFYSHPFLKNPDYSSENKTIKVIDSENDAANSSANMDKSGEPANKDREQKINEQISIGFSFNHSPKIKKVRKSDKTVRTGSNENACIIRRKDGDEGDETVTTQDWVYGGHIKPIEFKTLEIVKDGVINGLEKFFKVIDYIDKKHKNIKVSLNLVYIPKDKAFSLYPNGTRRNCAIVKIERNMKLPRYILEVGRADDWSISTLIIYQLVAKISQDEVEAVLTNLLNGLVSNNGHWDKRSIKQKTYLKFDMMKHVTKQKVYKWAERFIVKLF